ncbi:MAG: DODA-type extradiol aromatic ring-opening family dioxygenase [Ignavibacteria bacterium]
MSKLPVYFIPHGGGPWHIMDNALGDPSGYESLRNYLIEFGNKYKQIAKAILVISGHWEEKVPTVHFGINPPLLYDYYGFPEYTYHLKWEAAGSPELAEQVEDLLTRSGFKSSREYKRGFDHGTFVPLMVAFPEAKFPVIQLSLVDSLEPKTHINLGKALKPLRYKGVLIIGSGMSYHNMRGFMSGNPNVFIHSEKFDNWLTDVISKDDVKDRNLALINWRNAPFALESHPRSEHLVPLFVIAGAAGDDIGRRDYSGTVMGVKISGFKFG